MRAIAKEAGLSVGVAYRYFESRDALLGATMERIGERLAEVAASHDDPAEQMAALLEAMERNPAFARLATWLTMSGRTPTDVMASHPLARDVVGKATHEGVSDPEGVAAVTLFLTLSGSMYRGTINRAIGRAPDDRRLDHSIGEMFALWMSGRSPEDAGR